MAEEISDKSKQEEGRSSSVENNPSFWVCIKENWEESDWFRKWLELARCH